MQPNVSDDFRRFRASDTVCNRWRLRANRAMFVRAFILAVALALGGCSASELAQNWPSGPVPDLSQPNYQRIVADNIKTIFPKEIPAGEFEISGVRMVDHFKGPAWITCLKIDARGHPQHYAIFIQGDKIIDARASVVLDQCQKEFYGPFEVPGGPKKPDT